MRAKFKMNMFFFIAACPNIMGGQSASLLARWQAVARRP